MIPWKRIRTEEGISVFLSDQDFKTWIKFDIKLPLYYASVKKEKRKYASGVESKNIGWHTLSQKGNDISGKLDKGGLRKASLTEVLIGCGAPHVNSRSLLRKAVNPVRRSSTFQRRAHTGHF